MTATLREAMYEAVADVTPRPGLLAAARRSGQRGLLRRRTVAMLVAAGLVLTGAAASGLAVRGAAPGPTFAGPLGDGRTHGDLASDSAYAAKARVALRDWLARTKPSHGRPIGRAQILWAGSTPAGPASVLQQTVDFHKHRQTAQWFIGAGPDGPRVTSSNLLTPHVVAWYVDPAHQVLAVVDNGTDRGISYGWTYSADGYAKHEFVPLEFSDGVAVLTLPAQVQRLSVELADLPFRSVKDVVGVGNVEWTGTPDQGLSWVDPASKAETVIPVDSRGAAQILPTAQQLWSQAMQALESHTSQPAGGQFPTWFVYGATAKGHTVSVFQRALDSDPARLYALIDGSLHDEGPVRPTDPLPVRIHLGGGEGWLVAHYGGALRYRIGTGAWVSVGQSAAFVPEQTTEVAVVTGTAQQIVTLATG